MGTNFYWKEERHEDEMNISQHIGKRSAAGLYCYDCGTTLNCGGITYVHQGPTNSIDDLFNTWSDTCPCCGKSKEDISLETSPKVVAVCCSFTWTLMKHKKEIEEFAKSKSNVKVIVDEYEREFTAVEFLKMLEICPIEFQSPCEFC